MNKTCIKCIDLHIIAGASSWKVQHPIVKILEHVAPWLYRERRRPIEAHRSLVVVGGAMNHWSQGSHIGRCDYSLKKIRIVFCLEFKAWSWCEFKV
jgi:hypothetical protein